MVKRLIQIGAEASVFLNTDDNSVLKVRVPKSYRLKVIDDRIRKLRTRAESRILSRASKIISVPKVLSVDEVECSLSLEFIPGLKLSSTLNSLPLKTSLNVCELIGSSVSKLHDSNIIHGDLTTSNMILTPDNSEVFFIDFGLSYHSLKLEDKAVDLHVFKQALEACHFTHFVVFLEAFLRGYSSSKNYSKVIDRLKNVEARGRYRH